MTSPLVKCKVQSIAIYVGKNEPWRSIHVLGTDLAVELGGYVTTNPQQCKDCDIVLNLVIEDVAKIEQQRRYIGYGKQVCFFSSNTEEYTEQELIGFFAYMTAVPFIVHSQHHYDQCKKALKNFSPARHKASLNNLHFIWGGITDNFKFTGDNSPWKWLVPYNRVNKSQKAIDTHQELSNKSYVLVNKNLGMNCEHNFILPKDKTLAADLETTYAKIDQPENREDYIKLAQEHGLFICTSNYESLGLMYLELLACGVVGVFLDGHGS